MALNDQQFNASNTCGMCIKYRGLGTGGLLLVWLSRVVEGVHGVGLMQACLAHTSCCAAAVSKVRCCAFLHQSRA